MNNWFSRFSLKVAHLSGTWQAFVLAVATILGWLVTGPFLHFSEGWQLGINTLTTLITYLMVFVLQHTQIHSERSIQLKLDELIRAMESARNEFIDIEEAEEEIVEAMQDDLHASSLHSNSDTSP